MSSLRGGVQKITAESLSSDIRGPKKLISSCG
jgi:hypothetical protein